MKKVSTKRYTVLVLDTSSAVDFRQNGPVIYTANTALLQVKEASKKFVESMGDAAGDNYIALVAYSGNTSQVLSQFTTDQEALLKAIDSSSTVRARCSVRSGLMTAEQLIDSIPDQDAVKNVVLFTTA